MGRARISFVGFSLQVVAIAALASGGPGLTAEIDEVVVTARKRDQRLQDAPISISAIPGGVLDAAGTQDIFDIADIAPSLSVAQSTSPLSVSYFVRRIGNLGSIPNFEPAVGLYVDGALRNRSGAAVGDLFDLQRIEIIRGPQAALHGKNSTAGVVSILTNRPAAEFGLHAKAAIGWIESPRTARSRRLESVITGPLTPTINARASILYYDHDDTLINLFNDDHGQNADRYTFRGQIEYAAAPGQEVLLTMSRFRIDNAKSGDLVLFEGDAIRGINQAFGVPCPQHSIDERFFCRNSASVFELTSDNATLNLDYGFDNFSVVATSSFDSYDSTRDFDADQLNVDLVHFSDRQRGNSFSQELRLQGHKRNATDWLAGVFYLDSSFDRGGRGRPTAVLGEAAANIELAPGLPAGQPGDSGYIVSASETRHISLFGNVDRALGSKVTLTAAARWLTEDKSTSIDNFADHEGPTVITLRVVPEFANASLTRDTSGVAWELAGKYRWSDALMAYLQIARGFKSGGFNGGPGATPPASREFNDETVRSIELGFKSMLLQNRLRLNTSVFSARYSNFQSAGWVSLRFLVNNAERVDVSGLEVDLQAILNDRLSASAAISVVDAHYDRYTGGSCHYGRDADNADGSACDLSGRTLPLAPRTRAHLNLSYERPVRRGSLFSRLDWTWTSDYHTNASLDPRHVQAARGIVNARVGYRQGRWEITAWTRNAGDELIVMQEGPSNLFTGDPAYGRAFAMPRSYGVTIGVHL